MGIWLRLVITRRRTPRAIKRFENKMRFLVSGGLRDDQLMRLIGIGALVEVGEIAVETVDGLPNCFTDWKENWTKGRTPMANVKRDLGDWGRLEFEKWFHEISKEHWERYLTLLSGGARRVR